MDEPLLVVLAGRPGTGKTTLGRLLAAELSAAYVRIDAIETAVIRSGLVRQPIGAVGYVVAHEIAAGTLSLGTPVVVDAVNPVPEARQGWRQLAAEAGARLVVCETVLHEEEEHRRRVMARRPDLAGQTIPSWGEAEASAYAPWDEARDGPRFVIDMTEPREGLSQVLRHVWG